MTAECRVPSAEPRELTRRDLLTGLGLAGLGSLLGGRRAASQGGADTARQPQLPRADRLYDPSVVQERAPATPADNDPIVKDIEHRLKCTCGCNLDVYTCRTTDFTCTYSPALHREVLALRAEGKSPDQVVEAFVARYGESILMAPPPEGFNLAAYVVPGSVVAAVALVLAAVLVRRSRRLRVAGMAGEPMAPAAERRGPSAERRVPSAERRAPSAEPNPEGEERLRRALADIED
ncbi:MAG: cytochrome c-type biogenesis protein CcmH [Gemmatimonadales bacterium]